MWPFLKRISEIPTLKSALNENEDDLTCTHSFIKFLQWPEEETAIIDLKQASVVLMANLDRLSAPYIPRQSFNKVVNVLVSLWVFFNRNFLFSVVVSTVIKKCGVGVHCLGFKQVDHNCAILSLN